MARGSHRRGERGRTRLAAATGALFFCAGAIALPPLIVADLSIWLNCAHLDEQALVQLFVRSILLGSAAELGATAELPPGRARAPSRR